MPQLLIIPSIDIHKGKCVRVVKGIPELNTYQYSDDPVEMAQIWRAENAKVIHVVDFDGAWQHSDGNLNIIKRICQSVIIPVEFAGGVRTFEDAEKVFDLGVYRIVTGTMVVENLKDFVKLFEKYGPNKVAVSLDVLDDYILIRGRSLRTNYKVDDIINLVKDIGVERYIVTDIASNGTLLGANLNLSLKVAKLTGKKVTHSGGVKDKNDLMLIQKHVKDGIDSVIVGRALYENRFPCQKIWRIAEQGIFD
ncbi:MAG TPA: 1-(5-phosphoribosyl)-5-[(5-phosphoribosylamino)methylideneamino] imidazole-4-carboxamide isomerase [Ignavibacteriales bacterium]|nr:1-(5-phosphoribosyl)-5-[(5-phosphoribosylamino)methylideneamino] imidazole-4-carboxamide isomerase [Ignavibacteriales bacterium]HOL81333.1 1-(5-phosphoribosyl)-5-[(5-phosphoribosylamino)methylideneamino] imidazole-4-carboxamide isomerase [Ignavibacteriales bacterium]HOM65449.1 1-(5-phosphoribosyl)-5-[(5-phosphoribosylamino)methylideneamino] imidazole-4-carboxamide isomerase [Ignavibacteriales bacterium]HPD68293.1 1-(5-phosphoribosyl)-5-[(5-phosphoribosylamino)methylideneamino] imidazole-4-car